MIIQMTAQPTPKFTMRDLYARLADDFGMQQRKVEYYARFLREAELLDAGQPGRGGRTPPVTPRAAAVFLVGILGSDTAVGAPDAVKELKQARGSRMRVDGKQIAPAGNFLDTVAHILERMSDPESAKWFRKAVSRISVGSDPSGLTGEILTGSGSVTYHNYFRSVSAEMHEEGLLRERSVGSPILTKIADMLSTAES